MLVRKDDKAAGGMSEYSMANNTASRRGRRERRTAQLYWGTDCAKCQKPKERYIVKRKSYLQRSGDGVRACMSQSTCVCRRRETRRRRGAGGRLHKSRTHPMPIVNQGVTFPAEEVDHIY